MTSKETKSKSGFLEAGATVAVNKRARFEYEIIENIEAGLELKGAEVKSLRLGKASIAESYADSKDNDIYIINMLIEPYEAAVSYQSIDSKRTRKLLLHRKEINRLAGLVTRQGLTLIPLKLYFNKKGIAKIDLGVAKGKKLHDKRATVKDRDWNRNKARVMKENS